MSEPMMPPIDPALEQLVTAALHDHARSVAAPPDPAAMTARLVQQDRLIGLRRIGVISGLVVVVLAGLVVLGASRRDSELRTAAGPVTAVAAASGRHPNGPGGTDVGAPADSAPGMPNDTAAGSDLSIPLPGDIGADGATSSTAAGPSPGGVTTTSTPGVITRPQDGTPPTSAATGPGAPSSTAASTVPPTSGPTTGPAPTTAPTAPPTTIDPRTLCSAHQVNTEMRLSALAVGTQLLAQFDNGLAPPDSVVTVGSADARTMAMIVSRSTPADTQGQWAWSIEWNARLTPYNVPLSFFIQCANGTKLPFTVTRVR